MDVYNAEIYPNDRRAKQAIDARVEIKSGTADAEYLQLVESHLTNSIKAFGVPDLVVYNAGTDILDGDPLGQLKISAAGIVKRDQIVMEACLSKYHIPVLMLLSGGYQPNNAAVIASSIENLNQRLGLIADALKKSSAPASSVAGSGGGGGGTDVKSSAAGSGSGGGDVAQPLAAAAGDAGVDVKSKM